MKSEGIKLDHVAVGVPKVEGVVPLVVGQLGGREAGTGPGGGFKFWQWEFEGGTLEILEPEGPPDGFLHRFLASRGGAAPHHVTFKVPDIRALMRRASEAGHQVVGFDDTYPGWIEAFLHPKGAQGIVVQLVESHPEQDDWEDDGTYRFPATPADPPPAVTLVGVRLAAKSAERAHAQWGELLCGVCEEDGDLLVFRFAESPLRIAVKIDASLPEGPIALEIATDRKLDLPEGPHPALGIPIVQIEGPR